MTSSSARLRLFEWRPLRMMQTILLDVLLFLALATTVMATVALKLPSGPEGPVGAWLVFIFPCLFTGILVTMFANRGMLDFLPGGRPGHYLAVVCILITMVTAHIFSLDREGVFASFAFGAVPYLIFAGCLMVIHGKDLPQPRFGTLAAALVLGSSSLAGMGLVGTGLFRYVKSDWEKAAAQASKRQADEVYYEAREVEEYRALPADADLSQLLRFTSSRNAEVEKECRERVQSWPQLDDALIERINAGSDSAVTYIAFVYEAPPAKLAPAWAAMMDRQLTNWNVLQYDEYAGKWEPNLSGYFEGAGKIQQSGGNLKPQLNAWYEFLKKCKGLGNLAMYVKTLL